MKEKVRRALLVDRMVTVGLGYAPTHTRNAVVVSRTACHNCDLHSLASTLSQSTSMAIRMPHPRRILCSTPSSHPSVSPNSPPSLRWNTYSFRENISNITTQRISSLSISSRHFYRPCETRHRTRATPSKTAGARRPSSCVFPRSTRTSHCHSWERPQ